MAARFTRFTEVDASGATHPRGWALPLIVAAICVPVAAAFALQGAALGLAVTALVAATIVVIAARSRPYGPMEVAPASDGKRVLVLATEEVSGDAAKRVADLAEGAEDVRILVPAPSDRLDRWLSAEDQARDLAQDWLARSAGELTALGVPVSGSVGDSDPMQAVEDELRSFAAGEVIVVSDERWGRRIEQLRGRLALPMTRVPVSG